MRAGGTWLSSPDISTMTDSASGSIVKSSFAANRTIRSMRTGSSRKRTRGSPEAAQDPALDVPETIDIIDYGFRGWIVVERIDAEITSQGVLAMRTVDIVAGKLTLLSLVQTRPSWSTPGLRGPARNVATSVTSRPMRTWARRKRLPISLQDLNSSRTCSGEALVATSKSFGFKPSNRSRMQPPTT